MHFALLNFLLLSFLPLLLLSASPSNCSAYCNTCTSGSSTTCFDCPLSFNLAAGACSIDKTSYPMTFESKKGEVSVVMGNCGGFVSVPGIYSSSQNVQLYSNIAMPNHYKLRVRMSVVFIDFWEMADNVYVEIDALQVAPASYLLANAINNQCGDAGQSQKYTVVDSSDYPHISPSLTISAKADDCDCPAGICKACGWMLPQIIILISTCHEYCQICTGTLPSQCSSCSLINGTQYLLTLTTCAATCGSGYYNLSNICFPCTGIAPFGCLNCSSIACTLCDILNHFNLTAMGTCTCATNSVSNGMNGCDLCSDTMPGCVSCSSNALCTGCDTANHWGLVGMGCGCVDGYTMSGGSCAACGGFMTGCANCSGTLTCTLCDTANHWSLQTGQCVCSSGYALSGSTCVLCSSTLVGCTACNSTSNCTTCDPTKFFSLNPTTRHCQCSPSDFRTLSSAACTCTPTYFDPGSPTCQPCTTLTGCLNCTSSSICTTCDTLNHWNLTSTSCTCSNGYTLSGGSCVLCSNSIPGCVNCTSTAVCTACDAGNYWSLSGGGGCVCGSQAVMSGGSCVGCGALMAGCVGCSATSTCTSCDGGLNWEINSTKCVCKQGYIADGGSCVLCGVKIPGCTDCQNGSCSMCDEGNNWELSAGTCVCKQEYQKQGTNCINSKQNAVEVIIYVNVGIGLFVLVVGIAFWKLIGLEAMNLLQILFFSMVFMNTIHPTLSPVTQLQKYVNGYNGLFRDNPQFYNFNDPPMSKMLTQMRIGARFLQNINYMLCAQLLVFVVGGIFYLLYLCFDSLKDTFMKACKFVLNQLLLVLIIFNSMNLGFSLGIHFLFFTRPTPQPTSSHLINLIPAFLTLIITLISCYIVIKYNHYFEHNNRVLNENSKLHPVIMCCYRLIIGVLFGALLEFEGAALLVFCLQVGYVVYVVFARPYPEMVMTIRSIFNEIVVCVVIYNIQIVNSGGTETSKSRPVLWIQIVLVLVATLFSCACFIYGIFRTFRPKTLKITTQPSHIVNETIVFFTEEDQMDMDRKRRQISVTINPDSMDVDRNKREISVTPDSYDASFENIKPAKSTTTQRKLKSELSTRRKKMEEIP